MEFVGAIENVEREGSIPLSCEPHAIELPDGRIVCQIRVHKGMFTVFQSESDDKGRTWTKPHQILSDLGGSPPHLIRHSSGVVISSYGYREKPYGIRMMFSYDGCKTWDIDNVLYNNEVGVDIGYPATV